MNSRIPHTERTYWLAEELLRGFKYGITTDWTTKVQSPTGDRVSVFTTSFCRLWDAVFCRRGSGTSGVKRPELDADYLMSLVLETKGEVHSYLSLFAERRFLSCIG
jgi:hypothetical protein